MSSGNLSLKNASEFPNSFADAGLLYDRRIIVPFNFGVKHFVSDAAMVGNLLPSNRLSLKQV